ncbi:MAG TPA: hypothetical protein DCQ83_04710 [Fibrobacteres bacterium]|jgi:GT2 family glycosyltransferase|nr:hypothetical protein [Fibrobacterota bacterium]
MKSRPPRIALIILTYRFPEITLRCLESLSSSKSENPFTIFLINNYPEDGSGGVLQEGLSSTGMETRYIEAPRNLGFTGGMNLGIRTALKENFSHLVLLNNDTTVRSDFGHNLQKEIEQWPNDVLAGLVLDAVTHLPSANIAIVTPWTQQIKNIFSTEYDGEVDVVSGCFAIFPVEVFRQVGLFFEPYFMYREDFELCLRVKRAGFIIRCCPSMVVFHEVSASSGKVGVPTYYYAIRNQTHAILRHASFVHKLAYLGYMFFLLLYKLRQPRIFLVLCAAMRDAFLNRLGVRYSLSSQS